jgi:drug/metabolite transporter (DMT)-like permease
MFRSPVAARRPLLLLSFAAVFILWGSTYLVIRVALDSYPPFFLGFLRFVIAGTVLFGIARLRGEPLPTRRELGGAALTGPLFFVIGNGLVNVAERSVSSGLVAVLVATMPLWMTVFGRVFGARSTAREMAGVLLGLVGVVVLNLGDDLRGSAAGVLVALCAPLGWALGSVLSGRVPLPRGLMRTATQMFTGGLAMLPISLALREPIGPGSVNGALAIGYLVVFGSLLGFTAYSYLLQHTRPAVATSYAYVNPVIAVALGVVLRGEHFGATSTVGGIVVLAAVALVQKRGPSASSTAPAPARQAPPSEVASAEVPRVSV